MPIHEYSCRDCGRTMEVLVLGTDDVPECSTCGSGNLERRLSAPAAYAGRLPGPGDTGCCGDTPGHGGCAGPGSCCGRN